MKRPPRGFRALIVLTFLSVLAILMTASVAGAAQAPYPPGVRGEEAIATLGTQIAAVARTYGLTGEALAAQLRQDNDLAVDARGRLLYSCSSLPLGTDPIPAPPIQTVAPLSETFTLHSLPGAQRVIYLDFDGATLVNTAWNAYTGVATIVAPAWNTDGDPLAFGDAECAAIQQIWQRVAEDYLPFNVDVTTEPPAAERITRFDDSDQYYGMAVLVSPIASLFGNYGGMAYLGVYNRPDPTDYYKPALVFPEKLAQSEKYIAEAAAHEAGHTVGLSHDGTLSGTEYYAGQGSGETGWAPIMGVGYYRNLTQWSRGEYLDANQKQDDLAVMQTYGLPARADDAADAPAGSASLLGNTALSGAGIISTAADVDVFSFAAGAGLATFSVLPADLGANLDVEAAILDASGAVVASANQIGFLAGTLSAVLPADGTYYLSVQGSGEGDPLATGYSDYGSLGRYSISGTVPSCDLGPAPVAAFSAAPLDGDAPLTVNVDAAGSYDPDGGALGYAWTFGDGASGSGISASHTYTAAGTYVVTLTVTDDENQTGTTTATITVSAQDQLPVAVPVATPLTGTEPLTVFFDGTGSFDPDGSITSWSWTFGDGAGGSGATATHTYAVAGTYTATLTVTDNRGAQASAAVTIAVQVAAPQVKAASITMTVTEKSNRKQAIAEAIVTIVDGKGQPVSGARVSVAWSGLVTSTASGTTDTAGQVTFTSRTLTQRGTVTITITNVVKSGYIYTPDITQASISW
jgi:PKD repeat protein